MNSALQFSSLSDQVYTYLRTQMNQGDLVPGSTINIGEIAKQLGISKTPLRDALIHLELEGFVTILPRRGVRVNRMGIDDVKKAYDAVGLVEAFIVQTNFELITPSHIERLEELNERIIADLEKDDFSNIFHTNLKFHHVYIDICDNELLKKFILPIKHRLYDFPRQNYIAEWEVRNCQEHNEFIEALKRGDAGEAGSILKDKHWSFEYQKDFIYDFYQVAENEDSLV
ncbi:GntR family transcriptional regulator [Desulforhopalus singaporensis]|uniref:DNA-binding transcriptional regulator, GntR family n=1 Tax=Desulforhopalus singaporensis TaxID=91360 RepID=A0A1H0JXK9_9BACT|nr:GntR family transcriptional regulator [Desulforhopalus singaporensis]SDO48243.1 DNA-binding transcriptional regulator, GntR family [Desulforhopalus singaporensis]